MEGLTETTRQAVIDVLNETDRILDTQGWSSNGALGEHGEVCLGIAKNRASYSLIDQLGYDGVLEARVASDLALHHEIRDYVGDTQHIFNLNDHTAETLEDIKRVTKGARVRLGGES